MKNLVEAMYLRGYAQVDLGDEKISFRRIDDEQNKGDTQGWTFQYDNWDAVRGTLIDVPLWENEEMTKRIDALIGLTEEELIARMMSKYDEVYDESGRLNTINVNPHVSINKGGSGAECEIDYWHRHFMYAYSFEDALRVAVQIDLLENQLDVMELSNEQIRKIIQNERSMSLEERYTKAMELAGYERTEVDDVFGVYTVAFRNKHSEELIQADGWEMLGDELEDLNPLSETDIEFFEQLIHPEGRILFYCKNLGGTGLGNDQEAIVYPDLDSAINAYLSVETDGREFGYKVGSNERIISKFDTVNMQHQYVINIENNKFYDDLTVNEKQFLDSVLKRVSSILNKDNTYQAIYDGICTVAHKCAVDISAGKTEWGAWMGHIVNSHRPQDYIDVDIIGYVSVHEVVCNINVIHANEIISGESVTITTDPEHLEESIRNGIANAIKELDSYMHKAVELLDTDYNYPMNLHSPYTFNTLEQHYLALNDAGYTTFPVIEKEFRKMTHEDMKNYIQHFFKKHEPELICTSRVLDSLATTVKKMIDSGQISNPQVDVNELLVKDSIMNFVKERIPVIEQVSDKVQESVKAYFEEYLKGFTPIEICRASNHPEDSNLYAVIAQKSNGEYACWTSWHQGRESMNYGHYGLSDREAAFSIIKDNFNDISDELRKYGPEKSLVKLDVSENIEKQWNSHKEENGKSVVIPFVNRSRGR